jgi:hypothetical protein
MRLRKGDMQQRGVVVGLGLDPGEPVKDPIGVATGPGVGDRDGRMVGKASARVIHQVCVPLVGSSGLCHRRGPCELPDQRPLVDLGQPARAQVPRLGLGERPLVCGDARGRHEQRQGVTGLRLLARTQHPIARAVHAGC